MNFFSLSLLHYFLSFSSLVLIYPFPIFLPFFSVPVIFVPKGKEWDVDTEQFVHYNLSTDASRTLSFSDESLRAALKEKGSLAAIFNVKNGIFIISMTLFHFLFSL